MIVELRKSHSKPRTKGYCGIDMMLRWPRFMFYGRKTANTEYDDYSSSDELLPNYSNTSETGSDEFPEALALFNLHKYNLSNFIK